MLYAAVVVLVNENNEVLIVQRSDAVETYSGYWCFPGGGVDEGETAEDCAIRETYEETNLKVKASDLAFFYTITKDSDKDIYFFAAEKWKGKVKIDWESSDYKWIDPKELTEINFIPTPEIIFQLIVMWADMNDM